MRSEVLTLGSPVGEQASGEARDVVLVTDEQRGGSPLPSSEVTAMRGVGKRVRYALAKDAPGQRHGTITQDSGVWVLVKWDSGGVGEWMMASELIAEETPYPPEPDLTQVPF